MDKWVVAATAATGYIANYLHNLSKGKDKSPDLSFEDSPRCPLSRQENRKKLHQDIPIFRRQKLGRKPDDVSGIEVPSTSRESLGNENDFSTFDSPSLMPRFVENEQENCVSRDISTGEIETFTFNDSFRNRTFLRRKHRYGRLVKPLSSLESCLMAQRHKDQTIMEEYVLSPFPSPSAPVTRPLLVTDGTRVISRNSAECFNLQIQNGDNNEHVFGVPPLPNIESNRMKLKSRKGSPGRLNSSRKLIGGKLVRLHRGQDDAAILFCLGISVGIISSFIVSKTEVDKLKQALKQTGNLVQDLQEELEMKDSLTVKEIASENSESRKGVDQKNGIGSFEEKAEENSESMSKIEAELEAELERLELNIKTPSLDRRLTGIIGFEPDFVAEFANGELRADMVKGQEFGQAESNHDQTGNSTPPSGNYAVSPRELSLRLQHVIQSQLEERVKELEIALQESQRKVKQLIESDRKNSCNKSWENREMTRNDRDNPVVQPLVMNLAGEAVDAYNEAYEELMKINDSEEEKSSPEAHERYQQREESILTDRSVPWNQRDSTNESPRKSEELWRVEELLDFGGLSEEEEEEKSDLEDEMEKQLIQQIVEKTKQGSPVVLNAQRWLFLVDDEK